MKLAGCHVPNGLRARDEYGRMVCGRCGRGYDDDSPSVRIPSLDGRQRRKPDERPRLG